MVDRGLVFFIPGHLLLARFGQAYRLSPIPYPQPWDRGLGTWDQKNLSTIDYPPIPNHFPMRAE
jgi:hypothetical protein